MSCCAGFVRSFVSLDPSYMSLGFTASDCDCLHRYVILSSSTFCVALFFLYLETRPTGLRSMLRGVSLFYGSVVSALLT